jgi:signal transduction histidine kinase
MERKQVQAVVETLTTMRGGGETLAEIAHDARNMVTALGLYCDLLEEPGVLATQYSHYGNELRLVAAASRRLVEKLVAVEMSRTADAGQLRTVSPGNGSLANGLPASGPVTLTRRPVQSETAAQARQARRWELLPAVPLEDLAAELQANRNLLAALAGPSIILTVDAESGALPVRLTGEDLTRVLVNLVKNAAEAMPAGGRVVMSLREQAGDGGACGLLLAIEDSGPGIPARVLDKIFEAGFSTRAASAAGQSWPVAHRGLGLSISRSIIEAAGGRIVARQSQPSGARFEIELPVRRR